MPGVKKWYSLRVISGKERKIKERIELEVQRSGWNDFITQVLVPSEKVYKIRNGKKVILERNILPGYILLEVEEGKLSGEVIQTIANIPNVIHFLGRNNPIPMQASEANRMLGKNVWNVTSSKFQNVKAHPTAYDLLYDVWKEA